MYVVKDIIEPDFGCEGLPDGEELCCEVVIEEEDTGKRMILRVPYEELEQNGIDVGVRVTISDGRLFVL